MNFIFQFLNFHLLYTDAQQLDIMPELKRNILNFGYAINFKYDRMLSHSFDRFCVVARFELTKVEDLKLQQFS